MEMNGLEVVDRREKIEKIENTINKRLQILKWN